MKKFFIFLMASLMLIIPIRIVYAEEAKEYTVRIASERYPEMYLEYTGVTELPFTESEADLHRLLTDLLHKEVNQDASVNGVASINSERPSVADCTTFTPYRIEIKALSGEQGVKATVKVNFVVYASYHQWDFPLIVTCAETTYPVNIGEISHGSLSTDKSAAVPGETVTVTAEANEGFSLAGVNYATEGSDPIEITETDGVYSFVMPKAAVTLSAKFKGIPEITAPVGKTLDYNGKEQPLAEEGQTTGGTLLYSLDGENYGETVPVGTVPGTYTIFYKVEGNEEYASVDAASVEASIRNVYNITSGSGSEWKKGSADPLVFIVKATFDDEGTFARFSDGGRILIDGKEISAANYKVAAGSLKVTLNSAYLETLNPGTHKFVAEFTDNSSYTAEFIISAKAEDKESAATPVFSPIPEPRNSHPVPNTAVK